MIVRTLVLLIATSVMLLGCHVAANYPAKAIAVSTDQQGVPAHYDGKDAVYADDHISVFYREWSDPIKTWEWLVGQAANNDTKAIGAIKARGPHSLKSVIDDNLAMIITNVFIDTQGSISFTEGSYKIYFEDGSYALDCGVAVDMDPRDTTTYKNVRRSYKGMPLEVTRSQIPAGKKTAKVDFLLPRRYLGMAVTRIEYVGTDEAYSLREK